MGATAPLMMDRTMANQHHPGIMEKYQIPAESNLEEKP
jgi:hypothetical protein